MVLRLYRENEECRGGMPWPAGAVSTRNGSSNRCKTSKTSGTGTSSNGQDVKFDLGQPRIHSVVPLHALRPGRAFTGLSEKESVVHRGRLWGLAGVGLSCRAFSVPVWDGTVGLGRFRPRRKSGPSRMRMWNSCHSDGSYVDDLSASMLGGADLRIAPWSAGETGVRRTGGQVPFISHPRFGGDERLAISDMELLGHGLFGPSFLIGSCCVLWVPELRHDVSDRPTL